MTYSSYSVREIYLHYTFSTHYNIYKGKGKNEAKTKNATTVSSSCIPNWSDPGGTRTHDPLIKSQLLYQLSYGVIVCSIATAKVLLFSEPPTILVIFFEKMCFFRLKRLKMPIFVEEKTKQNY